MGLNHLRFPRIYAFAALAPIFMALQSAITSISPDRNIDLVLLVSSGLYILWLIAIALVSLIAVFQRNRRAFLHSVFSFILAALAFLPAAKSGDYLHFAVCYPFYMSAIYAHPQEKVFRFKWENPSEYISGAAGEGPIEIVYDRSGTIAANVGHNRNLADGDCVVTEHLVGNFYIERMY